MKSIHILFVAIPFFLYSCQNTSQKNSKTENQEDKNNTLSFTEKYTKKINQEAEKAKEKQQNTIFLNFKLGMEENEYKAKFDELVKQKTLKPLIDFKDNFKFAYSSADTTGFFYPLEINNEFYPLYFVPTFKEGKLSAISAKISPQLGEAKTENLYKNLVQLYTEKYGNEYLERVNMYKPNDFIWINSNRHITLSVNFASIKIDYDDINKMDINVQKGEKKKEVNSSSSLDDI